MLVKTLIVFAAFSLSLSSADLNQAEALNCLKSCRKSCAEALEIKKTQDASQRRELIKCMKSCHGDQCVKK